MARLGLVCDPHYGYRDSTHDIWIKFLTECATKTVDAWIFAGDIGYSSQDGLNRALKLIRKYLKPPIPICVVWGNHDWWDTDGLKFDPSVMKYQGRLEKTFEQIERCHGRFLQETSIQHLSTPLVLADNTVILGFDGWYEPAYSAHHGKTIHNFVKDDIFMPLFIKGVPMHTYMRERAWNDMNKVLNTDTSSYRKVVIVTHFPMFTENLNYKEMCSNFNWLEPLTEKADVLCVGHSHQSLAKLTDSGTMILNSGSQYNDPRYLIFEV